jgi:Domain of unknown function (DUF4439)
MTAPNQDAVIRALQRVLAAQHAAVYGYPVIGVRLSDPAQVRRARQLEAAHRQLRDNLMAQLAGRGATPVAVEASYTAAEPVTGPATARRWAVQLEQDCAGGYRYLLAATVSSAPPSEQAGLRQQALTGLTAAAREATEWRALLTPATPTVAFPGL